MIFQKNALGVFCALLTFTYTQATAFAKDADTKSAHIDAPLLQVIYEGDLKLSCGQLSEETFAMQGIMEATRTVQKRSEREKTGIGVAGAVGSFLIGSVTGGIGIAAAGYIAKEASSKQADEAGTLEDIAAKRQAMMLGIYKAKGCQGPLRNDETTASTALENPEQDVAANAVQTAIYSTSHQGRYNP